MTNYEIEVFHKGICSTCEFRTGGFNNRIFAEKEIREHCMSVHPEIKSSENEDGYTEIRLRIYNLAVEIDELKIRIANLEARLY